MFTRVGLSRVNAQPWPEWALASIDHHRDMGTVEPRNQDGALAEYAALRQEVDSRWSRAHNLLTTQLTVCGAVFGLTLASQGQVRVLLVVPLISYLLCARFYSQVLAIHRITVYIRSRLSPRVHGGLRWEEHLTRNPAASALPWLSSHLLTFPGPAALALIWVTGYVYTAPMATMVRVGMITAWWVGLAAAIASAVQLLRVPQRCDGWWGSRPLESASVSQE